MEKWLVKLRNEKNLTQGEVAKRANIARTTYSSIEQGRRGPSVKVAMQIAEALGFSWTVFFENKRRVSTHKKELTK